MADDASFNVLGALDDLRAAGFNDEQARALADTLQQVLAARHGELATKSDLLAMKADLADQIGGLKAEIADVRSDLRGLIAGVHSELKGEVGSLRAELLKAMAEQQRWTIGVMAILLGILFAAIKLI